LDKGLVFLQEQEFLVTGNYWNLVVNFDIQWYQTALQYIDQVFSHLERSQKDRNQTDKFVNWEEVNQARVAVDQVKQELSTLSKLLPISDENGLTPRRKRGLLNVGGEVLKFLFGKVTTQ
jgi:hypothetical protein